MNIIEAQQEMRTRFAGGFYGQLVSGVLWLVSAILASLVHGRGASHVRRHREGDRATRVSRRGRSTAHGRGRSVTNGHGLNECDDR